MKKIKLALIGNSISQSRAPHLHEMMGKIYNIDIAYDLKDPSTNTREAFESTLESLRAEGYTGCNVTFPFKSVALESVTYSDSAVTEVGATNTLYFADGSVCATNTDYTGFCKGYCSRRGAKPAGEVLMLGAGGVGRAVAMGIFKVGATKLYIYDLHAEAATNLALRVNGAGYDAVVVSAEEVPTISQRVSGVVNCSPVGHYSTPGTPLDTSLFGPQDWAFDAVYTPLDTEFMCAASAAGLELVSGFDLFFYQGLDAFEMFTGVKPDPERVFKPFVKAFEIHSKLLNIS